MIIVAGINEGRIRGGGEEGRREKVKITRMWGMVEKSVGAR